MIWLSSTGCKQLSIVHHETKTRSKRLLGNNVQFGYFCTNGLTQTNEQWFFFVHKMFMKWNWMTDCEQGYLESWDGGVFFLLLRLWCSAQPVCRKGIVSMTDSTSSLQSSSRYNTKSWECGCEPNWGRKTLFLWSPEQNSKSRVKSYSGMCYQTATRINCEFSPWGTSNFSRMFSFSRWKCFWNSWDQEVGLNRQRSSSKVSAAELFGVLDTILACINLRGGGGKFWNLHLAILKSAQTSSSRRYRILASIYVQREIEKWWKHPIVKTLCQTNSVQRPLKRKKKQHCFMFFFFLGQGRNGNRIGFFLLHSWTANIRKANRNLDINRWNSGFCERWSRCITQSRKVDLLKSAKIHLFPRKIPEREWNVPESYCSDMYLGAQGVFFPGL